MWSEWESFGHFARSRPNKNYDNSANNNGGLTSFARSLKKSRFTCRSVYYKSSADWNDIENSECPKPKLNGSQLTALEPPEYMIKSTTGTKFMKKWKKLWK